jgi:hypothetical protein
MNGWALEGPTGWLIDGTFGRTRNDSWGYGFMVMPEDFRTKYWKRWDASIRAAAKLGYRLVRVKVVKMEAKH